MLGRIQDELAKMIATEIYNFGKRKAVEVENALKTTTLRPSGTGLPPPVLVAFHESFVDAFTARTYSKDGYARWPHSNGEQEFKLLLRDPLVARIQRSDWVRASSQTADGVKQIQALGKPEEYQDAVSSSVGSVFDYTAAKYIGVFHANTQTSGWRLLSGVIRAPAAPEGTTQFNETAFLYWSYGSKEETSAEYKLSKRLLTKGSLWWKKAAPTSAGPFITV